MEQTIKTDVRNVQCFGWRRIPKSVPGQLRKSPTTFVMSVKPPKAEVAIHGADVRFVPNPDIRTYDRNVDFASTLS